MNGEAFRFEASVVARTPSGDVLIALFSADGRALVALGSVDAGINLLDGIADIVANDNGSQQIDSPK